MRGEFFSKVYNFYTAFKKALPLMLRGAILASMRTYFLAFFLVLASAIAPLRAGGPSREDRAVLQVLEEEVQRFAGEAHSTLADLAQDLDELLELIKPYSESHPIREQGVLQEMYLTLLTKIIRGAPLYYDNDMVTRAIGWSLTESHPKGKFSSGAKTFVSSLKQTHLDAKGISLLRGFLLAYQGVEEADIFRDLIREVEYKVPVDFTYSDYHYKSVYREGDPSFKYAQFEHLGSRSLKLDTAKILPEGGLGRALDPLPKSNIDDATALARLGLVMVNGPLPRSTAREVGELILQDNLRKLQSYRKVEVTVSPKIIDEIVERLAPSGPGMRELRQGIGKVVESAINGIVFDVPQAQKIEGKVIEGKIHWYADSQEVVMASEGNSIFENRHWMLFSEAREKGLQAHTPGFGELSVPLKFNTDRAAVLTRLKNCYSRLGSLFSGRR